MIQVNTINNKLNLIKTEWNEWEYTKFIKLLYYDRENGYKASKSETIIYANINKVISSI